MNDMDAALIQQLMEEDMSMQAAMAMQNEDYGGAAGGNNPAGTVGAAMDSHNFGMGGAQE